MCEAMESLTKACEALDNDIYTIQERSTQNSSDPAIKILRTHLQDLLPHMQELESNMIAYQEAVEPLQGLSGLADEINERIHTVDERERALEHRNEDLQELQSRVKEEEQVLKKAQEDFDKEVLEMQGTADMAELRQILRETRAELRDTKAALATKTRLLEQRSLELSTTQSTLAQLQDLEAQLQEELRHLDSQNRRMHASTRESVAKLKRELELSQQREEKAQDLLASEHRKHQTLQLTLQKELASRKQTQLPPVDERPNSAPHLDVLKTMQRNQNLINDITKSRFENARLREDNHSLLLHAKDANAQGTELRNQVAASLADRMELTRRLHRAENESKLWQSQLTKQAARTVQRHKFNREAAADYQWSRIELLQSSSDRDRYVHHTGIPQGTRNIQVHKW